MTTTRCLCKSTITRCTPRSSSMFSRTFSSHLVQHIGTMSSTTDARWPNPYPREESNPYAMILNPKYFLASFKPEQHTTTFDRSKPSTPTFDSIRWKFDRKLRSLWKLDSTGQQPRLLDCSFVDEHLFLHKLRGKTHCAPQQSSRCCCCWHSLRLSTAYWSAETGCVLCVECTWHCGDPCRMHPHL